MESSCCKYKIEQMNPEDAAEAAAIEAGIFSMPWSENGFRTSVLSRDTLYLCVRDGDSIWSIAKQYYSSLDSIRKLNSLEGDDVKAGDRLIVVKCAGKN